MNTHIILLKLFNGEMIIGEEVNDITLSCNVKTGYSLNNPREVGIMPTMTGSVQMALTSVCAPFKVKRLKDFIHIPYSQVMFALNENEIDNELIQGYKSEISGIKIATQSDLNSLNTKAQHECVNLII